MPSIRSELEAIMNEWKAKVEAAIPQMCAEIAKELEPEFKRIVSDAIDGFYFYPQGQVYNRTGNFDSAKNSTKVYASGTSIIIHVGEETMSSYLGAYGKPLDPSTAFDFFYMQGEHGHGWMNIGYSYPPYQYVESQLNSAKIDRLIQNAVGKVIDSLF